MKLGLGTVEFAAKRGKHATSVTLDEAGRILSMARDAGITLLDTAAQAGNSEEVLGEVLPAGHDFRILARVPYLRASSISHLHADQVEISLQQSLEALKQTRIDGLMIDIENGLLLENGHLLAQKMAVLRDRGLVGKIGVALTTGAEIDRVLEKFQFDMVQVPLNILDQRLLYNGYLDKLKAKRVEVYVRDVFLQGVLLDPTHLHPWFWPIRKLLDDYHAWLIAEGLTPMEAALNFVSDLPQVDQVLVGVSSAEQLREILDALGIGLGAEAVRRFACPDEKFTNPRLWNLYE